MGIEMLWTEIGLVLLALGCLVLDLLIPKEKRGDTLANVAMAGLTLLFCVNGLRHGGFGWAFGRSFAQDGLSLYFKSVLLLAAFFTLFMVREYQARLERGRGEFTLLVLFALIGAVFLASANDFLIFF